MKIYERNYNYITPNSDTQLRGVCDTLGSALLLYFGLEKKRILKEKLPDVNMDYYRSVVKYEMVKNTPKWGKIYLFCDENPKGLRQKTIVRFKKDLWKVCSFNSMSGTFEGEEVNTKDMLSYLLEDGFLVIDYFLEFPAREVREFYKDFDDSSVFASEEVVL